MKFINLLLAIISSLSISSFPLHVSKKIMARKILPMTCCENHKILFLISLMQQNEWLQQHQPWKEPKWAEWRSWKKPLRYNAYVVESGSNVLPMCYPSFCIFWLHPQLAHQWEGEISKHNYHWSCKLWKYILAKTTWGYLSNLF